MNVMCTHCGTMHTIPSPIPPGAKYRCARCYATLPVATKPVDPDPDLQRLEPRLLNIERRLSALEQRALAPAAEATSGRAEAPGQPIEMGPAEPREPLVGREIVADEKAKPQATGGFPWTYPPVPGRASVPHAEAQRQEPSRGPVQKADAPPEKTEPSGSMTGFKGLEKAEPPAVNRFPWTYPSVPDEASSPQAEARRREPSRGLVQEGHAPPRWNKPSGSTTALKDWEQALPGNWLSRIGAVALFIGLGFLAKMAYDRDWLNPVTQLILGLLFGGGLLWAGHHWGKRYRVWA